MTYRKVQLDQRIQGMDVSQDCTDIASDDATTSEKEEGQKDGKNTYENNTDNNVPITKLMICLCFGNSDATLYNLVKASIMAQDA